MRLLAIAALCGAVTAASAGDLSGLWRAERRFDADARGALLIEKTAQGWSAQFHGRDFAVRTEGAELRFDAGPLLGSFLGYREKSGIRGWWTLPRSPVNGFFFATPAELRPDGADRFRGAIEPRDDAFRVYLKIDKRADGSYGAFIRNPERNIGAANYPVDHLEIAGDAIKLIGRRRGDTADSVQLGGRYDEKTDTIALDIRDYGGVYDLTRDADEGSEFYPRGRHPERYVYRAPPALGDGWPVATVDEVGIDRAGIEKFIQLVLDMPMDSAAAPELHGVLVARHGKLALEEYFHGESRDKLHDTRSATKSLTATIVGAAIQAGAPLKLSSPVYAMMGAAADDPRKKAMTLEHLLMMRSGYFCDDGNPAAPGNENTMTDQSDEPDYYRFTLRVPMAFDADTSSVYCSANPNLALGMVGAAMHESQMRTFDRLLGLPLAIHRYAWFMDPAGHPYGGGSVQLLPRDFMKIGQLMLDGGVWKGRRILPADFVARASAPLHDLNNIKYGYLWWGIDFPYKDRAVHAYFAGGNGGQGLIVIPELDMVVAIYGGSYATGVGLEIQQGFTPRYILPSVREKGDDPHAPVAFRDFTVTYGRKPS